MNKKIIEAIDPRKDVDGFHPINVGKMSIGLPCFKSATPDGIIDLLKTLQYRDIRQACCGAWSQQYSW